MEDLDIKVPFFITGASGISRYKNYLGDSYPMLNNAPTFKISGEPTVEDVMEAYGAAIESKCDGIVAIGGGSALDLGKAVAAL